MKIAASAMTLALWAMAYTLPAQPAFEVASVKPSPAPGGVTGGCHGIDSSPADLDQEGYPQLGRCVISCGRLSHLVNIAWSLGGMQLLHGGPDWVSTGTERFDVVAKAEDPAHTTEKQLLTMLQNLLIERFQLKYHRDPVESRGFALMVDKARPKLIESKSDKVEEFFGVPGGKGAQGKPAPDGPGALTLRRYSIAMLAQILSAFGARGPVEDKTGLTGRYDITLSWDNSAGPTIETAVREQLGLRLVPEKITISNFVIDSAERPSAN